MRRITALPYVFALAMAMSIISCQKETDKQDIPTKGPDGTIELTEYEIASIAYANPKELSPEEVLGIVRNFEDSVAKTPGTKSTSKSTFEIIGKSYTDEKGILDQAPTKGTSATKVAVFDVAVKKGKQRSIAVVSGDERVPLVIAYVPEVKENEDPMLLISRLSLVDKVKEVERIVDSLYAPTISKLKLKFGKLPDTDVYDYVKNNIVTKNGVPRSKSVMTRNITNVISRVGPLSVTEWDQNYPFNDKMDDGTPCSDPPVPYPAGCFVIAAAQIQAYYRPNIQVNINGVSTPLQWDLILADMWGGPDAWYPNSSTYQHLTSFIRAVFDGCQTTAKCDGSSTASDKGISYLRQTLNVDNGESLNMTNIKGSLDQLKLVLATGFREPNNDGDPKIGHAWVIDGYAVTRLLPGETIVGNAVWQRYNMYLHCNLGWGGPGTGYYLVGKDNIGSLTFAPNQAQEYKINLEFFKNISKK
jgi:hypothetical protein